MTELLPHSFYTITKKYYDEKRRLHCEDGPAIVGDDIEAWYRHGKLHRKFNPALIDYRGKFWYQNGRSHRLDGPAKEWVDTSIPLAFWSDSSGVWSDSSGVWYISDHHLYFDEWIEKLETVVGPNHAMKMKLKWSEYAAKISPGRRIRE